MSIEAVSAAFGHSRSRGTAKLILIHIANQTGDAGVVRLTPGSLARFANVKPDAAMRAVQALLRKNEITLNLPPGVPIDEVPADCPIAVEVTVQCPSWCDGSAKHLDTRGVER